MLYYVQQNLNGRWDIMPKPVTDTGKKNLIGTNLIALRKKYNLSQRALAHDLQLAGYDMDKNVITRIETQQRYVTDIEIKAICDLFKITYEQLISPDINNLIQQKDKK